MKTKKRARRRSWGTRCVIVALCVCGVMLLALGAYAQFGARVFTPPQPVFPQGIDGAGSQAGYRALFFPNAMSMSTMRPMGVRKWPPGYASGTLEWSPPDVEMHAVRADGSIVPRRVIVSMLSPMRAPTIEIAARTRPGVGSIILLHAAWLWGPGLALLACALTLFWVSARKYRGVNACQGCGYDLSGLPQSAACPECGANR